MKARLTGAEVDLANLAGLISMAQLVEAPDMATLPRV